MSTTKINYTNNDRAIVNALQNGAELTLVQLAEATGLKLVSGHIVSALKKGLIAVAGEVEVERPSKRMVYGYNFITAEPKTNQKGKVYNYTANETAILNAASTMQNGFTLAELSAAMDKKISAGSINGLVKKGNIAKGEKVEISCTSKSMVNTYKFVKNITE